jgi:hypothetical protein
MADLGLSHRPTFLNSYPHPDLAAQLIEMMHPDTPRARNQEYRLNKTWGTIVKIRKNDGTLI